MFLSYIHRLDEAPVIQELKSKRLIQISNIRVENLTPRAFTFPFFFFFNFNSNPQETRPFHRESRGRNLLVGLDFTEHQAYRTRFPVYTAKRVRSRHVAHSCNGSLSNRR